MGSCSIWRRAADTPLLVDINVLNELQPILANALERASRCLSLVERAETFHNSAIQKSGAHVASVAAFDMLQ